MVYEDAETFLRTMMTPLDATPSSPLSGGSFNREAVANAFVMLRLLPEQRAEEILGAYRSALEARGFRIGLLTGELSVRPGAHGFQEALEAGPPARDFVPVPASVETGSADPPWPTPAECYLAVLASATTVSIGTPGGTVELDTARIIASVADALLWVGGLPPDSALLSTGNTVSVDGPPWREPLIQLWGRHARRRAKSAKPHRAALEVKLPLQHATSVIEGITAHEGLVTIQLYGHPWVIGEYWPMIAPCFQVSAFDDAGGEHAGVRGSGGGSPEGRFEFMLWPPVPATSKRIRVVVSTLWEAAWAEIDIPGRSA